VALSTSAVMTRSPLSVPMVVINWSSPSEEWPPATAMATVVDAVMDAVMVCARIQVAIRDACSAGAGSLSL
jgi:hypothetical protein